MENGWELKKGVVEPPSIEAVSPSFCPRIGADPRNEFAIKPSA